MKKHISLQIKQLFARLATTNLGQASPHQVCILWFQRLNMYWRRQMMKRIAVILSLLFASASYCCGQHDTYSLLLVNGKPLNPFDSDVLVQTELDSHTFSWTYSSTMGFHLDSATCAFLQSMPDGSRMDLQFTLYKNINTSHTERKYTRTISLYVRDLFNDDSLLVIDLGETKFSSKNAGNYFFLPYPNAYHTTYLTLYVLFNNVFLYRGEIQGIMLPEYSELSFEYLPGHIVGDFTHTDSCIDTINISRMTLQINNKQYEISTNWSGRNSLYLFIQERGKKIKTAFFNGYMVSDKFHIIRNKCFG